jgi:peptidyl-tRNA hydrolase
VSDLAEYVLRPLRKAQLEAAADMVDSAADAIELILTEGPGRAMSRFNKRVAPEES